MLQNSCPPTHPSLLGITWLDDLPLLPPANSLGFSSGYEGPSKAEQEAAAKAAQKEQEAFAKMMAEQQKSIEAAYSASTPKRRPRAMAAAMPEIPVPEPPPPIPPPAEVVTNSAVDAKQQARIATKRKQTGGYAGTILSGQLGGGSTLLGGGYA